MTGCQTCGGFGGHHDPVAHGQLIENDEPCMCGTPFTCLADAHDFEVARMSTVGGYAEYGHDCEHTSMEHGADGCNVPGCLCAFMSWNESDYDGGAS